MMDEYEYIRQRRARREKLLSGFSGFTIRTAGIASGAIVLAGALKGLFG